MKKKVATAAIAAMTMTFQGVLPGALMPNT